MQKVAKSSSNLHNILISRVIGVGEDEARIERSHGGDHFGDLSATSLMSGTPFSKIASVPT